MSCKYNININFSLILYKKQVNDDFYCILNSSQLLRPGYESSLNMQYKHNDNDNISFISYDNR